MLTKRSRVVRSSSTGDFGTFNQLRPIMSPVAPLVKKRVTAAPDNYHPKPVQIPAAKEKPEQPRRSIFTIGSPPREENHNGSGPEIDEQYQVFFQTCFYCKMKIPKEFEVFMYGYLRAFCSSTCRDLQIAVDEKDRKPSPVPPAAAAAVGTRMMEEPAKWVFGTQAKKKYTIAKFK